MSDWILILLIIAGLLTLLGLVFILFLSKKRKKGWVEPDYRAFYILGIIFTPLGIVLSVVVTWALLGITALGIIYLIIGLANRDKWKT